MRELSLLVERDVGIQLLKVPEVSCNFKICQISNDVTIFLDGYISDASCLGDLQGEDVLRVLYKTIIFEKKYGAVSKVNGHYNIVVVDCRTNSVTVITDRFALRPLYWSKLNKGICISTSVKRISNSVGFDAKINEQSLFEFIKFDFVLHGATFFKNINRLKYSSVNCFYGDGEVTFQQYSNWKDFEPINTNSVQENSEIIFSLLDRAVQRTLINVSSPAVTISGGLDSRVIAGLITCSQGGGAPAFFHCPLSLIETRSAQGVVDVLGGEMESFPLKDRLSRILSVPVEYGDGCTSINQFWLFELFKKGISPTEVDCVFDGFFLDTLMKPSHPWMYYDKEISRQDSKDLLGLIYGLPKGYYAQYFFDSKYQHMGDKALAAARIFLEELGQINDADQLCRSMYLRTRGERYVLPMSNVNQNFCNVRFPGLDYDLFDYCMTLPSWQIRSPEVYLQIFNTFFPELSLVEWAQTGYPVCDGIQKQARTTNKLRDVIAFYLLRLSVGKIDFFTPSADVNYSFRKDISFRREVLNLFRNKYCIRQGLIGEKGFRRLVNNILIGKNDFFILERLLAIELFFAKFVDG